MATDFFGGIGQALNNTANTMAKGLYGGWGGNQAPQQQQQQQAPSFSSYGPNFAQSTTTPQAFQNPTPNGPSGVLGASTGGGGGGGGNPPQQQQTGQGPGPQQNPQAPDTSVFDKMIEGPINDLKNLIGTQQQTTADTLTGLGRQRQTELDTENAQQTSQQNDLTRAGTSQTDNANNAIEEAKRMYAEMSQGTLARYGSTTGTGAFLNEQLGQSTGRNIAMLHQGLNQSLQDINDKIAQVKQTGELAIRGTNERFDQAILTEKDNLQKYINQIQSQESMLQSNKAQLASQAIQHYQDTVNNLNYQRESQTQQWKIAQLNADTQLKTHYQMGANLLGQANQSGTNLNNMGNQIAQPANIQNITPVTPTTPQDTGSTSMARPQQNAFQTATGMNNQMNNPFNSLA